MRHQLEVWNPFKGLKEFDSFFEDYLPQTFHPATDVEETDTHYVLSVDLPGVKKENIKIEMKDGALSISGERRSEKKEEKGTRRFFEKTYGKFERVFTLGNEVNVDKIEANYHEGVLQVKVPKAEASKPKLIPIQDQVKELN